MRTAADFIIAIDPGREKCGIAVLTAAGAPVERDITPTSDLPTALKALLRKHPNSHVVIGDGTSSEQAQAAIVRAIPELELATVPEGYSTERALERWRDVTTLTGWRRLLPRSLRFPPGPIDDFAAWILAEDYLATLLDSPEDE